MFSIVVFVLNKIEPTYIITVVIKIYNLWLETDTTNRFTIIFLHSLN